MLQPIDGVHWTNLFMFNYIILTHIKFVSSAWWHKQWLLDDNDARLFFDCEAFLGRVIPRQEVTHHIVGRLESKSIDIYSHNIFL